MIIPEHYTAIRYRRSGHSERWDTVGRNRRADDYGERWPEISFRVVYWMQPAPSTEEHAGEFMTGFCDAEPLGHKVYVVRGWKCDACSTVVFSAGWHGLDHLCVGLGDEAEPAEALV